MLKKSGADCPNYRRILQHRIDFKIIFYFLFEVPQIYESPVPSKWCSSLECTGKITASGELHWDADPAQRRLR